VAYWGIAHSLTGRSRTGLLGGRPHRESGDRKSGDLKPLFSSKSRLTARAVTGVCAEKESHKLFYAKKLCRIQNSYAQAALNSFKTYYKT